jgi:hypothetical protein
MAEVLHVQALPDRSQAFARLTAMLGASPPEVTQLLWEKYDPSRVWTPFAIAGILAAIALFVFNHLAKGWKDVNA